jgi:hypothetical protein
MIRQETNFDTLAIKLAAESPFMINIRLNLKTDWNKFLRFSLLLLGLLAAGSAAPSRASAQNLVQNGNFALSSYAFNNQFGTPFGGQGVTNWTGNGGYNIYFLNGTATTISAHSQFDANGTGSEKLYSTPAFVGRSPSGDNFVALDGDPSVGGGGGLSQTINGLTPGAQYAVSFVWAASQLQSRTGATTEKLQVSFGSSTLTTMTVSNPSSGFTGWFTQSFTFLATSAHQVLSFLSQGTPNGDPPIALLTDVSVTKVPEPGTVAVLGVGLVGLLMARRRHASHSVR